jgi:tubulin monoglycylase TTLL3/8
MSEYSDQSFEGEGDLFENQDNYCNDYEDDNEDDERNEVYQSKESNSLNSEDVENNVVEDEENNDEDEANKYYEEENNDEDEENNDEDEENNDGDEDNVISPPQFKSYLNNDSNYEIEFGRANYEESDFENDFVANDINKGFLQKYFGVNDDEDDDDDEDNYESDDDENIGSDLMAIVNDYNEVVQLINTPTKNEKPKQLSEKIKDPITLPMNKKKLTPEKNIENKLKKNKKISLENENYDGYEDDKPKNRIKNKRENKQNNSDNDNFNNGASKEKNQAILKEIDEKHRSFLGEVVNKRRQEEEEEINKQRRASEKRKKFKDSLLEKALKSRNELELKDGDVVVPGFYRNTKAFDEQAIVAAAMKKRLDNTPSNLTEEEKIKLEEEKIKYISKIRRKFKQQQKKLLQALSTKRKEVENKNEQDKLIQEKRKENHRKKTMGLAEGKYISKDTNDIEDVMDGSNNNNLTSKSTVGAAGGGLSAIRSKIISSKTSAKDVEVVEITPEMLEAKKIASQQRQLKMTNYLNSISEQKKKDELEKKKNEERLLKRKFLLSERVRKEADERKLMVLEDKIITNNVIVPVIVKKKNYVAKEKRETKVIIKREIKDHSINDSNKENLNSVKCTPEMTEAMLLRSKLSRAKVIESIDSLSNPGNVPVRDFADWKRKNSVPADGNVFSMTGWYPCVKQALLDRGWYFNPDSASPYFDLKWTLRSIDVCQDSLQSWQLTNHFLKNVAITTKIGLLKSLKSLTWLADASIDDVIPRGFDLSNPQETQAFIDDFRLQQAEVLLKSVYFKVTGLEKPADSILVQEGNELIGEEWCASDTPRELDTKQDVFVNKAIFFTACTVLERFLKSSEDSYIDEPLELDENKNINFTMFTALEWELISQYNIFTENKLTSEPMEAIDNFLIVAVDDERTEQQKQRHLQRKQRSEQVIRDRADDSIQVLIPVTRELISRIHSILSHLIVSNPLQAKINGQGGAATNMWIVKPAAKSRGRGIATFVDIPKLLKYVEAGSGFSSQWVVQKYMENQLLIAQRKFDIRQWVLVVDWNPLTIYFFDECYLRFSADEYDNAEADNPFAHLSNTSIVNKSEQFKEKIIAENGDEIEGLMWDHKSFSNFVEFKAGDDLMSSKIQPRMKVIFSLFLNN